MSDSTSIPLCVDLDGTLVKLDTLHQALFLLLRRNPVSVLQIPRWIVKGKAHLKDQVMQRVSLDAHVLPYHQEFLAYLHKEHQNGRVLVLATASNYRTADAVAEHLGIFSETLSSNADTNLRHERKLEAIQHRFPEFSYAGNDVADFPIWEAANEIILVNPSPPAYAQFSQQAAYVFREQRSIPRMLLKAMRCQQWLKNLLVFSPMLLAHQYTTESSLPQATAAFFAFSFAASAIYILNDLFDLSADQHHPRKCQRPFAAGELSIQAGALLIPALAMLSLLIALFLPPSFLAMLLLYFVITTLYSWRVKQVIILDVLTLAGLYSIRIIAGAYATGTTVSSWFIGFSIFLFLSLAMVKRLSELHEMKNTATPANTRRERGYKISDLPFLTVAGTASGYLSALTFMLYLNSDKVAQLYSRPALLWLFFPLLLYWITRVWILASRGKMHDDPLAFAAKDPQTYAVGALSILIFILAI
jgi:4-hydroxybenzoate polyprenyltransferase/phosphoserine phosphatase